MPEDHVLLTGDAGDLIAAQNKAIKGWNRLMKAQQRAQEGTVHVDKNYKILSATFRHIDEDGQRVTRRFKKTEKGLEHMGDAVTGVSAKLQRMRQEQQKAAQEQKKFSAEAQKAGQGLQKGVSFQGATRGETLDFKNQIGSLKDFMQQNKISAQRVNQIWADVASGKIKAYQGTLRQLQNRIGQIQKAQKNLGATTRKETQRRIRAANKELSTLVKGGENLQQNYQKRLTAANRKLNQEVRSGTKLMEKQRLTAKKMAAQGAKSFIKLGKQAEETKKQSQSVLLSWQSIIRLVSVQLSHQALSQLTMAMREAATAAVDLQIRIAEIRTISQEAGESFDKWSTVVRDLADSWNISLVDQAEAAYQSLSNQVVDSAAEFRQFGNVINKFAAASVSTAEESANLLTGTINAFNLSTAEANRVAAQFFKTIELGRVRAKEMANSFGNIAILANQLNIGLAELQGAVSTLTIQGVKFSEAATQLRGIMIKLLKPTEETKDLLRDLGVESGEAAIKTFGFANFLKILQERTQGSSTELAKYINRIRGISGALAFTGEGFELLKDNIREIENASQSFEQAVSIVMENTGKEFRIAAEQIKNFFIQDLANEFLEDLQKIPGGFETITTAVKALVITIKKALIPAAVTATLMIGTKFVLAAKQAVIAAGSLRAAIISVGTSLKALSSISIFFGITAGAAIVRAALESIETQSERLERQMKEQTEAREEALQQEERLLKESLKNVQDYLRERGRQFAMAASRAIGEYNREAEEQQKIFEELNDALKDMNKDVIKNVEDQVDTLTKAYDKLTDKIKSNQQEILQSQRGLESRLFQFSIEGLDPSEQANEITNRLSELRARRRGAVDRGDLEAFNRLTQNINKLFNQRKQILQSSEDSIGDHIDFQSELMKLIDEELKQRKRITEELKRQRKIEREDKLEQIDLQEQLKTIAKEIREFDRQEVLGLEDPKKIRQQFREQGERLKHLAQLREEAGLDPKENIRLQERFFKNREAVEKRIANLRIESAKTERDLALEAAEKQTKALNEQRKNLIDLRKNAFNQAEEILKADLFKTQVQKRATQQVINVGFGQDIIQAIGRLKNDIPEGTFKTTQFDQEALGLKGDTRHPTTFIEDKFLPRITVKEQSEFIKNLNDQQRDVLFNLKENLKDIQFGDANQKQLQSAIQGLNLIISRFKDTDLTEEQRGRQAMLKGLRNSLENLAERGGLEATKKAVQTLSNKIGTLEDQLETASQMQTKSEDRNTSALDHASKRIRELRESIENFKDANRNLAEELGAQGISPEKKASGGFISGNTAGDSRLIQATPGEFVVNKRSAQRFKSQLLAVNAGIQPNFDANRGGVSIGDINVTVTGSGNESVDALEIGKALEKELRRGTVDFNV